MNDTLRKWKPILDNVFKPYELEDEIMEMLSKFLEKNLEQSTAPPSQQLQADVFGKILEFKERLTKDVDLRVNVKNTYYNKTINRIVYELENGDSVYMESKPLVMKDPSYIEKSKKLFLSISDPTNPLLRKFKIEDIRNNM